MKLSESRIKEIIKEEIHLAEMEIDPYTIAMGVGGLYGLYRMFFGSEPDDDETALQRVRDHINKLEAEASMLGSKKTPPPPPASSEKQRLKNKLRKMYQMDKQ